jgi:hypothetical protein
METLGELQRAFFGSLYLFRIQVAIGSIITAVVLLVIVWRAGWFAAARRHIARSATLLVLALAIGLPMTWYLASPIWIRTQLIEPDAVADVVAGGVPAAAPSPSPPAIVVPTGSEAATAPTPAVAQPPPFAARTVSSGPFHGTDEFHFGRGSARIVETSPGTYTLRVADFSVRNGPDLYVYLSPDPEGYSDRALELGKLKATDGAFGYALPAGTDPGDFASAIIWCKQFSHLFAVAPLGPI